MKRSSVLTRATLVGVCAVVLPLLLAAYVGWLLTLTSVQQRLDGMAQVVAQHTDATVEEASSALRLIANSPIPPCSPEGLDQMRLLAMNTFSVKTVGYVEEDIFACGSQGLMGAKAEPWVGHFVAADGVLASLQAVPWLGTAKPMLALQHSAFHVLVDAQQFLEVVVDGRFGVAVGALDGQLLNASNPAVGSLLTLVHTGPLSGMNEGFLYTVVRNGNWLSVAAIPRSDLWAILLETQLLTLSIGLVIAGLLLRRVVRDTGRRLSPLAELESAVRHREFIVHYQPIIELRSGRCIGAEALVRWRKADGSMVRPDLFIPLAEESGLILPITDQVMEAVMRDLGPMLAADRSLHVALNLAANDVCSGRFLPILLGHMQAADVLPCQVWLEATERGFMHLESAKLTIAKARALGFRAAVDDFGTGYSSLQYLQQLPLDALKIDKAFVSSIGLDASMTPLIGHVIEMANTLKLELVAEGVETAQQLDYLRAHHVQFAQGWLFAKALPAEGFKRFCLDERAALLCADEVPAGLPALLPVSG
jgi:sensor c-di-GMP phosphodiesterase-like protein